METKMRKVLINEKWELLLPNHRVNPEWWKTWEKDRLAAIHKVTNKDSVIFDIGAEQGDFTALFASWGAKVVAFEPNADIWPNIRATFTANDLDIPLSFPGFASNVTDLKPENMDPMIGGFDAEGWPLCSLGEVTETNNFRSIHERTHDTPSITIDDFVALSSVTPTILNIDVEGGEYLVLEGAQKTLKDNKIDVFVSIHPEMLFHIYQKYMVELMDMMGSFGYSWQIIAFDHELHVYFSHDQKDRVITQKTSFSGR